MDDILEDVIDRLKQVLPSTDWENEPLNYIWQTYVEYGLDADVTMTPREYRKLKEAQ